MVSRDCFFIAKDNALICWDFNNHKQYELSAEHAEKLISIIYGHPCNDPTDPTLKDLKRCEIITDRTTDENAWGWDILSRIFHIGTKNIPLDDQPTSTHQWANQYLEHCNEVLSEIPPAAADELTAGIQLPATSNASEFDKILGRRATMRNFHRSLIPIAELGQILHHTLGFIDTRALDHEEGGIEQFNKRRCSPSAGGLNATEGYVYIANVEGIAPGIYRYDPHMHQLYWRNPLPPRLGDLLSGQHFANDIPVGLFLTSRFDKLWWKYEHSRAYRMALIEIGHVAQTFQLAATACGMNTWLTGALNECLIEPLLNPINANEQVLFFVGCGYSDGSAIPDCLKSILKKTEAS
ncbi:SagB family peptide dehydrogenase [Pseudomonas putida]